MNLKELSNILGLSPTTVSRALNDYPEVSANTRRIVKDAARQHNYQPNARARGLAIGRSSMIGYVLPLSTQDEMVNPIFGDFVAGAAQTLSSQGYDSKFIFVDDDKMETSFRDLRARGAVDGLIVQSPKVHEPRIELLKELQLPFVVHGRTSSADGYNYVDVNNRRAFKRATDFLIDLGHKNIALINGDEKMEFAWRRRQGFVEALKAAGLKANPALMVADEMSEGNGYRHARKILESKVPPSAFVISSLIPAIGVRRAIEEKGFRLGRDISIIIHDDDLSYLKNGEDVPIFTATRSSVREAGQRCAHMLIDQINQPDKPPQQYIFEAELVLGQSTGPFR